MPNLAYSKLSDSEEDGEDLTVKTHWLRLRRWDCLSIFFPVVNTILLLLVLAFILLKEPPCEAESPSNWSYMPKFPSIGVLFKPDSRFASVDTFENMTTLNETLKQWTSLSTRGRGTILVEQNQRVGLSEPYRIPLPEEQRKKLNVDEQELYMVAAFHQLHCLSTLMTSYGKLVIQGERPEDIAHDAHCFDLLRQALICGADLTVEGVTPYGTGWGAVHQCRDINAISAWADERAGFGWHHFPGAL